MTNEHQTTENNGHRHFINDPDSGFTDPAPDGHFHKLITGCSTCAKIRAKLNVTTLATTFVRGHLHYFSTAALNPTKE